MIRVRLIHRDKRPGNYSIERVFELVRRELRDRVMFEDFTVKSNRHRVQSIIALLKSSSGINHITGDVHYLSFGLPRKTTIVTVHDIGHYEQTLKGIRKTVYKWIWLKGPLRRVEYITCVSAFTKEKLVHHIGIAPERIRVIHNPYPPEYVFEPKVIDATCPVILQIGGGHNKNRAALIEAVKGVSCKLILIGPLTEAHQQLLSDLGVTYENPTHVDAEGLHGYYKRSDIVFFASTYEGFGLPIIEAQAIGRPVITSTIEPMPEVAGKGAIFVDPKDIQGIQDAILHLAQQPGLHHKMVEAGLENVRRFQVGHIAEQYYRLYQTVSRES